MRSLEKTIVRQENYRAIRSYLPGDHSRPHSLERYLAELSSILQGRRRVLDLGCGKGDSIDLFRRLSSKLDWYGVDIADSAEGLGRTRQKISVVSFNGIDLPYPDRCFDLIYCNQVLEHVRHPDALMREALRVIKPGGVFLGSVSYLEPFHSHSIFNFTPYAIARVFGDAGFRLEEIRPETDAAKLIGRQLCNRARLLRPLWDHNYLYAIVNLAGRLFRLGQRERNYLKIQFSGHLVFRARRPGVPAD